MLKAVRVAALSATVLGLIMPGPAQAYIGPGAGLGAIAATAAFLLGGVLLVIGLVWYPLKRLFKGKKDDAARTSRTEGPE